MHVAYRGLGAFIDAYHGVKQFVDAAAALGCGRDYGHSYHLAESAVVELCAVALQLVIHVEGYHHGAVHVDKLGGEVEVALEIGAVNHVDDYVGGLVAQIASDIQLFGRIGGERVGAGKVDDVESVAVVGE